MNKFEIQILSYFDKEEIVAEVYYANFQWAEISQKLGNLIVKFYSQPNKKYWEFSYKEMIEVLEQTKHRLLKKINKNSPSFSQTPFDPRLINQEAQEKLERILTHPEKTIISAELNRFGKVTDIYAPNIGGARYSINGEFIGFLEPR